MVTKSLRFSFTSLCLLALSGCSSQLSAPLSNLTSEPSAVLSTAPATVSAQPQATQVALLLPLNGGLQNAGRAIQEGFNDSYAHSANHPTVKVYDTSTGSITSIYEKALQEGANYVVGPLDKNQVSELAKSGNIKVNTIALNDAEESKTPPRFYQFSLSPNAEAVQVADKASQAGLHSAVVITPSGKWGEDIARTLEAEWQKVGGTVVGQLSVSSDENIKSKIDSLPQNADVIFLIARPSLAREINPLLNKNTPVYSTSLVYTGLINSEKDKNLNGIKFCDEPLVLDESGQWANMRQQLTLSQPVFVQQYIRLYGLGYDAATLTQDLSALNAGINGATGQLSLRSDQHIARRLTWAVFQKGIPNETA